MWDWLKPTYQFKSFFAISWQDLKRNGIEAVCLDKDNCITLPEQSHIHDPQALEKCLAVFGPERVAILSNTAGYREHALAQSLEKISGVSVIRHTLPKPYCQQDLLNHFKDLPPHQIVLVGDRLLTDVLMANRMGCLSILVNPIDCSQESLGVRIARTFESLFIS